MKKHGKKTQKSANRKSKHPIVEAYLKAIQIDMEKEDTKK
jgi:hypothetical protein